MPSVTFDSDRSQPSRKHQTPRLPTGIPGLDSLTHGGLPRGKATLVSGSAGSGKTVMCCQFLSAGVQEHDEPGVFVSFEETPADLRSNMRGFGWDIEAMEKSGKWLFIDATMPPEEEELFVGGNFDLSGLRARISQAVTKIGAKRLAFDSMASLFIRMPDVGIVRNQLAHITHDLKSLGVTALMTTERPLESDAQLSRFGVEEYVADAVILLRNMRDLGRRRRTVEILKLRGGDHSSGEYPFSITSEGIITIPLGTMKLQQPSSDKRVTSGCAPLDEMCGGGFFQDSVTIVSGATGTGKTLTAMTFAAGAAQRQDRTIIYGFEESRSQMVRNAAGWGIDLEKMERNGLLQLHCQFPESGSLQDHLTHIRESMDSFKPARIVVDSISALQRIGTDEAFREFVIALTSLIKARQISGLYTTTSEQLFGGQSVTDQHISTLTDAIILLRYVEHRGDMLRGLTVLKMRGSQHDKRIREFFISGQGMSIGEPFVYITGVLSGQSLIVSGDPGGHASRRE